MNGVGEAADVSSATAGSTTAIADSILSRAVKYWHGVAVEASKDDYSHEGQSPEAIGPCYSSRISAMVHVAMYDAYVGITKEGNMYNTYGQKPPAVDTAGARQFLLHVQMLAALCNTHVTQAARPVHAVAVSSADSSLFAHACVICYLSYCHNCCGAQ